MFGSIGKAIGSIGSKFSGVAGNLFGGLGSQLSNLSPYVMPAMGAGLAGYTGNPAFTALGLLGGIGPDAENFDAIKAGRDMGHMQRGMMDKAYPGTNAWERLGTGQSGAQGYTEAMGRSHQKDLQSEELASRDRVANKQALASVAPEAIKQHPELAGPLLAQLGATSVGPNLSKAMTERRFSFEQRVKDVELALNEREVNVSELNASTQRWMADIAEDRLNVEEAYKEAEILLGDKQAAIAHVQALSSAFNAMEGDAWRSIMSRLGGIDTKEAFQKWLDDLASQAGAVKEAIKDVPAQGISMRKNR